MNEYDAVVNVLLAKERIDTVKHRYLRLQNFCLDLFLTPDIETLGDRPCINYGALRWMTILFVCDSRVDILALSNNYSDKKVDLRSTLDAFLFSEDSDAFRLWATWYWRKGVQSAYELIADVFRFRSSHASSSITVGTALALILSPSKAVLLRFRLFEVVDAPSAVHFATLFRRLGDVIIKACNLDCSRKTPSHLRRDQIRL
jgi:hypothetical protein